MKLEEGANKFRILSAAVVGFVFWTVDNKPVRVREYPQIIPANIRADSKIKHFWAFAVWNYAAEAVQVLELTQATIQTAINDLIINDEWGEPTEYDITIVRKGEGLETEYTVQPSPHKAAAVGIVRAYESKKVKLDALFDGGSPFEDSDTFDVEKELAGTRDERPAEGIGKMPPKPKSLS